MTAKFKIKPSNRRRVVALLRSAPKELDRSMRSALRLSGQDWLREMKRRTRGVTRPDGLARRTGDLARSLFVDVQGSGVDGLTLRLVSAGVSYVTIHETGGTVRPKVAKYLTIPIADNLTAAKDSRYPSARDLFSRSRKGFRPYVFRSKKGNLLIGLKEGEQTKLLFSLKREVKIPARLGFFQEWRDLERRRAGRLRRGLAQALRRARL